MYSTGIIMIFSPIINTLREFKIITAMHFNQNPVSVHFAIRDHVLLFFFIC